MPCNENARKRVDEGWSVRNATIERSGVFERSRRFLAAPERAAKTCGRFRLNRRE